MLRIDKPDNTELDLQINEELAERRKKVDDPLVYALRSGELTEEQVRLHLRYRQILNNLLKTQLTAEGLVNCKEIREKTNEIIAELLLETREAIELQLREIQEVLDALVNPPPTTTIH